MKRGKTYWADLAKLATQPQPLPLYDAVALVKSFSDRNFDQSVELAIELGIDPRQADQQVRGSVSLPHGIGVSRRVIAFCGDDHVAAAKEAGAVDAGGEALVERIEGGWMEFDVAVAAPDMMRVVSRLGRVLGPKGLMPSPKAGTVTKDVVQAVSEYTAGRIEFRNDSGGNVHAAVGKKSFDAEKLADNAHAFLDTIRKLKPASARGQYIEGVAVAASMTPGVEVAL